MYANSSIVTSSYLFDNKTEKLYKLAANGWRIRNILQSHVIIFLGLMALIAFIYIFWAFVVRTITYCIRCFNHNVAERLLKQRFIEYKYENDFYSCVDFRTLINELDSALDLKKAVKNVSH